MAWATCVTHGRGSPWSCAGVVIGEAARVGDHVTLMQYVTLGGTGKETGDRHPKVLEYAQVGAHSTVLGAP